MTRAIFIDRDGTLNEENGYISHPTQLKLYDFAFEAIRHINHSGWKAIVATNQSGVARGYFSEAQLAEVHVNLNHLLKANDTYLDAIYYCPHHPNEGEFPYHQECLCRKPRPGLLHQAERDFELALAECFVIGDRYIDIECARRVGAKSVLVLTGYGRKEYELGRSAWPQAPNFVAEDLLAAVTWILNAHPNR